MLRALRYGLWALLAALSIAIAGVLYDRESSTNVSDAPAQNSPIGAPFQLIDHNGAPITELAMDGHPAAVFFGFTHCPEICPTTLYNLANWLGRLGNDGRNLKVFFISVDPHRDTPQIMKEYVGKFSDRITGITGDPAEIAKLTKAWHIYTKLAPLEDGEYTMDHTASIFLVRKDGSLQGTIGYQDKPDIALQKLRILLSSQPS